MKVEFTIPFAEGLHARPAAELVKICQKAKCDIEMTKEDITVNPKSILGILSIGAGKGDQISVELNGEDEEQIAAELQAFFG
ncbi:HPr family phosphocarrier protein [Anaerotalea alkaliphila]|uniref:Phosphocarrier protein HPr n=1 Tax=Anaerotalea alkaliphila TaxID=2662126 RepID=A0A7X5KM27_9FIRM|nr:HPr family phosphocarrier protein [Anaerotalea alkaliphila]NDL67354.1 HPr family phosphocarrier protein [Anaerotalea alkaliphila]